MRRTLILVITLFLVSVQTAIGMSGQFFTADSHLSSSALGQIFQDSRGFIWIASNGGIDRYDGGRFMSWHRGPLQSNTVTSIAEDFDGRLFVGTNKGLHTFDYDNNTFIPISCMIGDEDLPVHITSMSVTPQGDLLAFTSGYKWFVVERGATTARQTTKDFDGSADVATSIFTPDGTLWMITRNRVVSMSKSGKTNVYFDTPAPSPTCLAVDNHGQLLVGTDSGVYVYENQKKRFTPMEPTRDLSISSLCPMANGGLMLGVKSKGIHLLPNGAGAVEKAPFYNPQVDMDHTNAGSIIQDRDGGVWAALSQKGVYMHPTNRQNAFRYIGSKSVNANIIGDYSILSLAAGGDGTMWVGTDGDGLYHIDPSNNTLIRHYPGGINDIPSVVTALHIDCNGRLWAGSWQQGGGWIDTVIGAFNRLQFTEKPQASNVLGFAEDSKGRLWIGTGGDGLYSYDLATEHTTHYDTSGAKDAKSNSLTNLWVGNLLISPDGERLYICLSSGLNCLDLETLDFVKTYGANSLLPGQPVHAVCVDGADRLWVGTADGIVQFDEHGHEVRRYTTDEGLPHNHIHNFIIDALGQMWVSTMHGVAVLRDDRFLSYYAHDGLQGNEWQSGACRLDSVFAMGGTSGLSLINPVALSSMERDNITVRIVEAEIDGNTVPLTTPFTLRHTDGSISIRFATMIFDRPDAAHYLYSIDGGPYVQLPGNDGVLTLSHLGAGTYYVKVKAAQGEIESEPVEFSIKVQPPLYASWWAIILYALIAAAAGVLIYRSRQQRLRNRRALEEYKANEQMKEAKLQFFMNLNHEIRTPMSLIAAPLQQLVDTDHDEKRQRLYGMMQNASQRILSIINQILDLRKIDRGLLHLHMRPTDLGTMVREVASLFEAKAAESHITMRIDDNTDGCEVWVDPAHFDKVIMNLLSNAFKYTPEGGNVGITVAKSPTELTLTVWDDGRTIAPENIERIFERFFQEDNSTNLNTAGTGIGLNLVRQLVQLHHGAIIARNRGDEPGCAFEIVLPLGCEHLDESEKALPEDNEHEQAAQSAAKAHIRHKTIIVAEDDEGIREYLRQELGDQYNVVACANGRLALGEALRCPPDLVITDVMMPEMDGYTLCARLKANTSTNYVPVIMLTAKTRESDKLEGLGQGADAYIEKPFNMQILRHTIRNLIAARDLLHNKMSGNEVPIERIDEARVATPDEKLMERITRVVNAHIDDPHLSVEQIADEVGISRAHLHRKMKELTNLGPRDWVRSLRLERAAQLLRQGNHNISQVIYACGFDNPSAFSTKFKAQYGMSPSAYMKEHNK